MIHVIPLEDIKEHIESEFCECKPSLHGNSEFILIIHNAFDGRDQELVLANGLCLSKEQLN